jgi:hypothetical protein
MTAPFDFARRLLIAEDQGGERILSTSSRHLEGDAITRRASARETCGEGANTHCTVHREPCRALSDGELAESKPRCCTHYVDPIWASGNFPEETSCRCFGSRWSESGFQSKGGAPCFCSGVISIGTTTLNVQEPVRAAAEVPS